MNNYTEPPDGMKPIINNSTWKGYLRHSNWTFVTEINPNCRECLGQGTYWTEWSDAAERSEMLRSLVLIYPEPTDGTVLIKCSTCYGIRPKEGEEKMMQDDRHGTHGREDKMDEAAAQTSATGSARVGFDPGATTGFATEADPRVAAATGETWAAMDSEPYSVDNEVGAESDVAARAYQKVWGHYQCAYNATRYRALITSYTSDIAQLVGAILGRTGVVPDDDLVFEATQERARLLARIDQVQDTVMTQAATVHLQHELIRTLLAQVISGQQQPDYLFQLAVLVGAEVKSPRNPKQMAEGILAQYRKTYDEAYPTEKGTPQ
jgi:hypothetical protein